MNRHWSALLVMAHGAALSACMVDPPDFVAGFVLPGPSGDLGWNFAHERAAGAIDMEGVVPVVEFQVHSTGEGLDEPMGIALDDLRDAGVSAVFLASNDYGVWVEEHAAEHPDLIFEVCVGESQGANWGSYFARQYQPFFVAGLLAGQTTQAGKIGIVGPKSNFETVMHANAFALGVGIAQPDAQVRATWTGSWLDPDQEGLNTGELLAWGADVIVGMADSTRALEVVDDLAGNLSSLCPEDGGGLDATQCETLRARAAGEGAWSGAFARSMATFNEDACGAFGSCLTSVYIDWRPLYESLIAQMMDGSWTPQKVWPQMQDGDPDSVTGYTALTTEMDASLRTSLDQWRTHLSRPENVALPFSVPLLRPDGEIALSELRDASGAVATNRTLSDGELYRMCYYLAPIDAQASDPIQDCDGDSHL